MLARRVGADGRTRAYLNGRSAAVGELRRDRRGAARLLRTARAPQADAVRGPAGDPRRLLRRRSRGASARLRRGVRSTRELELRLQGLRELSSQRERELDLLEYELAEIDAVGARPERARAAARRARATAQARRAPRGRRCGAEALAPESGESRRRRTAAGARRRRARRPGRRRCRARRARGAHACDGDRVPGPGRRAARLLRARWGGCVRRPRTARVRTARSTRSKRAWLRSSGSCASTAAACGLCSSTLPAPAPATSSWRVPRWRSAQVTESSGEARAQLERRVLAVRRARKAAARRVRACGPRAAGGAGDG